MNEKTLESPYRKISLYNRGELLTSPSDTHKDLPVKELKKLARTGGRGGKLYDDTTGWDYFPDDCFVTSSDHEDEVHEDVPFIQKRRPQASRRLQLSARQYPCTRVWFGQKCGQLYSVLFESTEKIQHQSAKDVQIKLEAA